jgi:uncharacterized repeat protein (TIGR03803 family)
VTPLVTCRYFLVGFLALCLLLTACGGGSSNNGGGGPVGTGTIASVTISCTASTVPVGQTNQCNSTVQGTGNFNSAVSWSVSGVPGGNSTVGIVSSSGLYVAPVKVPTPFTVTITATSVANTAMSASTSAIVSGTIASMQQPVSATSGGTITLPDGSSVTIAPGAFPADETVTLSEVSFLPDQPPNGAIAGVGAGLILSFSSPVQFSASLSRRANANSASRQSEASGMASTSPGIQFSLDTAANNVPLLQGSVPFADFKDASNTNNLTGLLGSFDSVASILTGNIDGLLLSGFSNQIISIEFGAANFVNWAAQIGIHIVQAPNQLSFDAATSNWTKYSSCPTGKTLVVVHGMLAFVEDSFPPSTVQIITTDGGYQSVVGFDYNWLQSVNNNGVQLADFLSILASCSGVTLDVEAHSEGVAVSMSALTLTTAKVKRFISVAGPIMGTPTANDTRILEAAILMSSGLDFPSGLGTLDLATVLASPFVSDLTVASGTLAQIRAGLASASQNNAPQIFVVGGDNPQLCFPGCSFHIPMIKFAPLMGTTNFDGVVPLTSALGFESGLKVYPLPRFVNLGHNDLVSDSGVESSIGRQVKETVAPSLDFVSPTSCTAGIDCSADVGTLFGLGGANYSPNKQIVTYEVLPTGEVSTPNSNLIADSGGAIPASSSSGWTDATQCSDMPITKMFFGVDKSTSNSSNAVTEQELAGSCTPSNPVPTISSLSPPSLSVGSTSSMVAINGSGFLASTSVSFNGASRMPTFESSSQLQIALTASDLAAPGSFPIVATNPAPGGGSSNSVNFTVSSTSLGSVALSPLSVTVPMGGVQTFTASVTGSSGGVVWSVQEGTAGGAIISSTSNSAIYSPPDNTGTFHVVATNVGDSSQSAVATVTVVAGASSVVLHNFLGGATDGTNPGDALIQAIGGNFYGTTEQGGSANFGTVFKMDSSGNVSVMHSFTGFDGTIPISALVQASDGNFYGTAQGGGTAGFGTIFKMDTSGNLSVLHSFTFTGSDGDDPIAALIQTSDGNFYGSTRVGGTAGFGTVFKMDSSGNVTVLHSFTGSDGDVPAATLIQAKDGSFYGTTEGGGTAGCGTIFRMDNVGNVVVMHSFTGADGCSPAAGLIQAKDGIFYGTTIEGGTANSGTAFKMDGSGNVTVLHSFIGRDGDNPYASLVQASDGNFYGTTQVGGAAGLGTVFRMDSSGNVTVLHSFTGQDGSGPKAGLLQGTDGNLYGTTESGGSNFIGVVFRINPSAF